MRTAGRTEKIGRKMTSGRVSFTAVPDFTEAMPQGPRKLTDEGGIIAGKILGSLQNPEQTHQEGGLLTRLESGQVDAAAGYESEVRSAHLPYIALPDEINLSNPAMAKQWYDTVSFTIKDSKGQDQVLHTQPMVFYAAVLKNAPDGAEQGKNFVAFMQSAEGQKIFKEFGYAGPKGENLYAR